MRERGDFLQDSPVLVPILACDGFPIEAVLVEQEYGERPMSHVAPEEVDSVHAREAASLYETRVAHRTLPHVHLHSLKRVAYRLLAHFGGLAVAGDHSQRCPDAELESPSRAAAFIVAVRAPENGRADAIDWLLALGNDAPLVRDGLMSALGWVERRYSGTVPRFGRGCINSGDPTLTIQTERLCPDVDLPGTRAPQSIDRGKLSTLDLPTGEPPQPFD